ncbi:HNH endonuclease [Mycobacterium phage Buttons]|nr:HNH endonuclease [Mycobacterium phage Buttons]
MEELWRPIPGWEGRYSVSNEGRVRSEEREFVDRAGRTQRVRERILSAPPDSKGRPHVQLFRDNRQHTRYPHQLVMSAFVGPQPKGLQVCHGDGNPLNNRLSNLRYDTDSANKLDAVRHGTHTNAAKRRCRNGHPYSAKNTYVSPGKGARHCRTCIWLRGGS